MIHIASFQPSHEAGLVSLILPIQQAEFGIPISLADQPDLLDVQGFYMKGRGHFWVALEGEQVVGSIGLLDIGEGQAALRKMFVAATHRGAEHGTARQLLQALLSWAREQGLREVFLGTTDKFLAAHRFYEKHGFRRLERSELPARFPVMAVDSRFYAITLDPA